MTGVMSPKTPQSVKDAEIKAAQAQTQADKDAELAKLDEEYRRNKQRGKSSTILSGESSASTGRTLLGG